MDTKAKDDIEFFASCFWDVDRSKLDFATDSFFIISRILEQGTFQQILALRRIYPDEAIIEVVKSSSSLSPRVASYWANYFDISLQDVRACLKQIQFQLRP